MLCNPHRGTRGQKSWLESPWQQLLLVTTLSSHQGHHNHHNHHNMCLQNSFPFTSRPKQGLKQVTKEKAPAQVSCRVWEGGGPKPDWLLCHRICSITRAGTRQGSVCSSAFARQPCIALAYCNSSVGMTCGSREMRFLPAHTLHELPRQPKLWLAQN